MARYELGGKRRGQKRTDTFYPGFRPGSSNVSTVRKVNRTFGQEQSKTFRLGGGGFGGANNTPAGQGDGGNTTAILPIIHDPIQIADGDTADLMVADALIYGGVVLDYTFERDGRWGSGEIRVWLNTGGADAGQGIVAGDDPNISMTASVVSDVLTLHLTAENEGGLADLNIAFITTAYMRRITP